MKKILIIGGTSGIGASLANLLAENTEVYVASRSEREFDHSNITWLSYDALSEDPEALKGLPEDLDGFVYCPGSIALKPFKMLGIDQFQKDMEINFMGLIRSLKLVLPKLKTKASMVFFSTVAVGTGMPFHTSVSSAKGAIEGFARALAAEYAPNYRVNVIAPSLVDTPLADKLLNNERKREKMAERHPLKQVGKPEDIAQMAAFLLSDKSGWVTGQVFGVDGGMSSLNLS